jgi:hypothetical protein
MGDLNYRINFGTQAVNSADEPTPFDFESLCVEVEGRRFPALLEGCQLKAAMINQEAFHGFQEPAITFPPTFKASCGSQCCE